MFACVTYNSFQHKTFPLYLEDTSATIFMYTLLQNIKTAYKYSSEQ